MAKFLTQDWFDRIAQLNQEAGELHLPPSLANLILNVKITGEACGDLHLAHGYIHQNTTSDAASTISIDYSTLHQIAQTGDVSLAIEAFMMGKIRVDGDMSQVLSLQSTKPSPEQKALYKQILAMTEFS